jgi:hypothetical protein
MKFIILVTDGDYRILAGAVIHENNHLTAFRKGFPYVQDFPGIEYCLVRCYLYEHFLETPFFNKNQKNETDLFVDSCMSAFNVLSDRTVERRDLLTRRDDIDDAH